MTLVRGAMKSAIGLTTLYLVFWRPLPNYSQWYNDMQLERLKDHRIRQQIMQERQALLSEQQGASS